MSLPAGLFAPPLAHRGLWRRSGPPENSLAAFDAACRAGYGIELDVRLSADGEAMVLHDDELERMTGVVARVQDLTAIELSGLRLLGGPERPPAFADVLEVVAGRAMMLVELKPHAGGDALAERIAALLDAYEGPAAVISFDPDLLAWFAERRPARPRGLDAMWPSDQEDEGAQELERACALGRPDFLALHLEAAEGPTASARRAGGQPVIAWTVRSPEEAARLAGRCDNFIFEGFSA